MGLAGVIYLIWFLNHRGLPEPAAQAIGLKQAGQSAALKKINLCHTRIIKVSFGANNALYEEKMRWVARAGESDPVQTIDQIAVEKWFAAYCMLDAGPVKAEPGVLEPIALFNYVDKSEKLLFYSPKEDAFNFDGASFESQELKNALGLLSEISGLENPLNSSSVVD